MTTSLPLPADVFPRGDGGWYVIPHVLPIDIPADVLTLTVAEWLQLDQGDQENPL